MHRQRGFIDDYLKFVREIRGGGAEERFWKSLWCLGFDLVWNNFPRVKPLPSNTPRFLWCTKMEFTPVITASLENKLMRDVFKVDEELYKKIWRGAPPYIGRKDVRIHERFGYPQGRRADTDREGSPRARVGRGKGRAARMVPGFSLARAALPFLGRRALVRFLFRAQFHLILFIK